MIRVLIVVWDILYVFGGWCIYRNPRLFDRKEADSDRLRINKITGIVIMIFGITCTAATMLLALVKRSN